MALRNNVISEISRQQKYTANYNKIIKYLNLSPPPHRVKCDILSSKSFLAWLPIPKQEFANSTCHVSYSNTSRHR